MIKGPHVVRLKHLERDAGNIYLLSEYCDGGNLL